MAEYQDLATDTYYPGWELDNAADRSSASSIYDAVSGSGSFLSNLANVWGSVEIAKVKSSQSNLIRLPNGQIYREGQLIGQGVGSAGGISPLMLLILAGVAVMALRD